VILEPPSPIVAALQGSPSQQIDNLYSSLSLNFTPNNSSSNNRGS